MAGVVSYQVLDLARQVAAAFGQAAAAPKWTPPEREALEAAQKAIWQARDVVLSTSISSRGAKERGPATPGLRPPRPARATAGGSAGGIGRAGVLGLSAVVAKWFLARSRHAPYLSEVIELIGRGGGI